MAKNVDQVSPDDLVITLEERFASHPERHVGIEWSDVLARLRAAPEKLRAHRSRAAVA